eukprot:1302559-Prymnesium_polylepis.1
MDVSEETVCSWVECKTGCPSQCPDRPPPPSPPPASCATPDIHSNCAWHKAEGNCVYPYWEG